MRSRRVCCPQLVLVCALVPALLTAQVPGRLGAIGLSATPWQLVRFEGGDGRVVTPDVRSKYTISFGTDGQLSARFDCNHVAGCHSAPDAPFTNAFREMALPAGGAHSIRRSADRLGNQQIQSTGGCTNADRLDTSERAYASKILPRRSDSRNEL